jgi:hypothetical protein
LQSFLPFYNPIKFIRGDVAPLQSRAAEPLHLKSLHGGVLPQAEVNAEVALREVTPPAFDLAHLRYAAGGDSHARADGVAVHFCAD